ncbi:Hypothetical protein Y17_0467 [Pectobacterium wasabiae CFBP 3304]|nr:Hypothetical protein Y17_0467 [Pectobacterium wasabiae CFBP 3304]
MTDEELTANLANLSVLAQGKIRQRVTKTVYTRHTSSCMCVGFSYSPQSLTHVSSWGLVRLPSSCNSNYLVYNARQFSLTHRR